MNQKQLSIPSSWERLIIEWIIDHHHFFNEIETESFRKIIEYIDKTTTTNFHIIIISFTLIVSNTLIKQKISFMSILALLDSKYIYPLIFSRHPAARFFSQSRHTGSQMTIRQKWYYWLLKSLRRIILKRILQLLYIIW